MGPMNRPLLLLHLFGCLAIAQDARNTTAVIGATVIDGTGTEPAPATVLIRGERIIAVGRNLELPADARVVRADGQTLVPGLFDLHTHLSSAAVSGARSDWGKNLKAYLYCGVTSVVDFGAYPETFEPMRRLLATAAVPGPRVSLAARFTTPLGHGAEGGRGDFFSQEVLTPREARRAMARVLPYQPDVIKVFTDGWRYGAAPDMTSMEEATLKAIVEEAHKRGIEVLTHTVTLERAKIAARAGVNVIAHGIGDAAADEELILLMKAAGTTYAPTLAVYETRERDPHAPLLSKVLEPAALKLLRPSPAPASPPRATRWKHLLHNVGALRGAGIPFGVGTDAGVTGTYHGWATLRELRLLVDGGLTPLEAITAATGASAKALQLDGERGTIQAGRLADFSLVDGAPHRDIADIFEIRRVFLGGREIDRNQLARDIASQAMTPLPAVPAQEKIDDFEGSDGRSQLGTLRVNSTDSGFPQSRMLFVTTLRKAGDRALMIVGQMSEKDRPFARANIPLSRGAIQPMDARAFQGIRFDARGDGEYRMLLADRRAIAQERFQTGAEWRTIRVPFSELTVDASDLINVSFEISRPAGQAGWLEIDNVRFYR
jgi:imidazolonepropionase-like amidohydrolase